MNYAIWPEALEMGKIAGDNAAGEAIVYEQVPAALTFEGMNTLPLDLPQLIKLFIFAFWQE